jgi:hypothetical protein
MRKPQRDSWIRMRCSRQRGRAATQKMCMRSVRAAALSLLATLCAREKLARIVDRALHNPAPAAQLRASFFQISLSYEPSSADSGSQRYTGNCPLEPLLAVCDNESGSRKMHDATGLHTFHCSTASPCISCTPMANHAVSISIPFANHASNIVFRDSRVKAVASLSWPPLRRLSKACEPFNMARPVYRACSTSASKLGSAPLP